MEHLTDKQLLEWLERSEDGPADARAHLDQCENCRLRWQELRRTWDAMGAWTAEMPPVDLAERVLGRVASVRTVHLWQPRTLARIAASVIIGLGLGAATGRVGSRPVSAEQVSQAIYLDSLALDSSTGWAGPMLDEPQEP